MDCPNDKKDSIVSYTLHPEIIYSGNHKLNIDYAYDLLNVTLVHLNETYDKSNNELIRMMDILLSNMAVEDNKNRLEFEHFIPMTVELDEEMSDMCNISLGIEARGEARGIEKTKTEMIINMLKEKVSIDVIAKVAKLTAEQITDIGKKAALL